MHNYGLVEKEIGSIHFEEDVERYLIDGFLWHGAELYATKKECIEHTQALLETLKDKK